MSGSETARNYALRLEYDGHAYVGWQLQASGTSIQHVVEAAASRLAGGRAVASQAAGRTDAGVHAEGQVVRLELPDGPAGAWQPDRLRDALNFHLKPHPIVVLDAVPVADGWSPRFDAVLRRYRYRILNRRARPAVDAGRAWHVQRPLDASAMREAAGALLGRHDFTSFRASSCQARSPVRTLDRLEVRQDDRFLVVETEARSFLHHQVRNIVGTLERIGSGRWPVGRMRAALEAADRRMAGPTAPACGLTLMEVRYEPDPFGTG